MKVHGTEQLDRLRDLLSRTNESDAVDASNRQKGGRPEGAGDLDTVQLSPEAKEMQHLRDLMSETPEVREQLVNSLRDEIASGRYHFDGTHLADELLRESYALSMTPHETDGDA